jgi:hypothetical protein
MPFSDTIWPRKINDTLMALALALPGVGSGTRSANYPDGLQM